MLILDFFIHFLNFVSRYQISKFWIHFIKNALQIVFGLFLNFRTFFTRLWKVKNGFFKLVDFLFMLLFLIWQSNFMINQNRLRRNISDLLFSMMTYNLDFFLIRHILIDNHSGLTARFAFMMTDWFLLFEVIWRRNTIMIELLHKVCFGFLAKEIRHGLIEVHLWKVLSSKRILSTLMVVLGWIWLIYL